MIFNLLADSTYQTTFYFFCKVKKKKKNVSFSLVVNLSPGVDESDVREEKRREEGFLIQSGLIPGYVLKGLALRGRDCLSATFIC